MDRDLLKMTAEIDQMRAEAREILATMPGGDLVGFFRACAAGRPPEHEPRLVGLLAALAIFDLCRARDTDAPPHACPRCGEDDIDRLVWVDDDLVRCESCGTIYDPNAPKD
ncbi:MAG: hypothetical protein KatS3mg105_0600 [Gemmatales bacterium]|nr:MAG: hypothetical protein KatS3mg105_0600 [Gemmatales bacterium]